MISNGGVLSVRKDKYEFTTLERWEEEFNIHQKIIRIPFFAHFKKWEPFYIWRTKVRSKKMNSARNILRDHLFMISRVCDRVEAEVWNCVNEYGICGSYDCL